ncbi:regulation of nuclear pre-mRNA domain-containing protein 2-like isoform X2 [Liolophura sinensis]|uniref:regulation of nuclear pre-mRNA domain-containing protein 2-like isoform X2 n=1 Tax=Liolophura sinensis TaxID=3198878 RepID=UPI003158734A
MASTLNEESVEKKLQNVTNTQDSIQTLSLWIIHHKAHHKKIVRLWFKVLRKAKIPQRLTLFYLCNDVVQHGRKKATVYLESFKNILKDAVMFVRDSSIRPSILRIFTIWEQRNVFRGSFLEELRSLVSTEKTATPPDEREKEKEKVKVKVTEEPAKPKVEVDQKILAEFKPQKLFDKLRSFKRFEAEVELRSKQLSHLRLDASSIEAVKQLKDRAHGNEFSKQFEDSCVKLEEFVGSFEKGVHDRKALITALEEGELFYQAQFGEARIVANAYKIFGTKLNNLKKKLDELKKTLPEPASPVPSPSVDAPSPGSTPQYEPDTEAVDMEMSDDDAPIHPSPSHPARRESQKSSPETTSTRRKSIESTPPKHSTKSEKTPVESSGNNLEDRIANMLPSLPIGHGKEAEKSSPGKDSSHWNGRQQRSSDVRSGQRQGAFAPPPLEGPEDGGGTPLKDEGSSTPVQDEAPEPQPSNPIDFLTKLISQTQKTNPHSSNFLQNLGILANTMKHKTDKQKDTPESEKETPSSTKTPPQSWSAWKAKQTQDKTHVNGQEVPPQPLFPPLPVPPPSQPPPISPSGRIGAYGTSSDPQLTPPSVPVGPPSPNIPGLPNVSIPPPWLPLSQPPPPPHISPHPPSPSVLPGGAPQDFSAMGNIPMPVQPPDFLSQANLEDVPPGPRSGWEQPASGVDLLSPPPAAPQPPPKSILRNSARNSALREVKLVPSGSEDEPSSSHVSQIPIIGAVRSRSSSGSSQPTSPIGEKPPSGPKPPPHPPGQIAAAGRRSSLIEDQKEFIEKLKRKTSVTVDGEPPQPLPKPQIFSRNPSRPNLTTIILTGEPEGETSAGSEETRENVLLTKDEEEPKGAPISTINRSQPLPRFPVDPVDRPGSRDRRPGYGQSLEPRAGALPRRFDYRDREREVYRDRRDEYLPRRHDIPPPDRYLDGYSDPYYLPRDPYSHPTPPKRPYPDPYYGHPRSYYPPRY